MFYNLTTAQYNELFVNTLHWYTLTQDTLLSRYC